MTTIGRPKEYRNVAEKQRAYRERQKQLKMDSTDAMKLLELVKAKIITLRKCIEYHQQSKRVEIESLIAVNVHKVLVNGYCHQTIEDVVFQYLLMTDQLEFKHKRFGDNYYEFKFTNSEQDV